MKEWVFVLIGRKEGMIMSDILGIFSCVKKFNSARLFFSERGYENFEMKDYTLEKSNESNDENPKIYTVSLAHIPIIERTLIYLSFDMEGAHAKCQEYRSKMETHLRMLYYVDSLSLPVIVLNSWTIDCFDIEEV